MLWSRSSGDEAHEAQCSPVDTITNIRVRSSPAGPAQVPQYILPMDRLCLGKEGPPLHLHVAGEVHRSRCQCFRCSAEAGSYQCVCCC